MSRQNLKANTPKRWAEPNPAVEFVKNFILITLLSFAVLCAGFLIWYLIEPVGVKLAVRSLKEMIFGKQLLSLLVNSLMNFWCNHA